MKKLKSGISRAKSRVSRKGSRRARGKLKKLKLPELKLSTASQMRHAGRDAACRQGVHEPARSCQPRPHRPAPIPPSSFRRVCRGSFVSSALSARVCRVRFVPPDLTDRSVWRTDQNSKQANGSASSSATRDRYSPWPSFLRSPFSISRSLMLYACLWLTSQIC